MKWIRRRRRRDRCTRDDNDEEKQEKEVNDETNSETTKWNTIELELFQRILTKKKHSTRFNRDSSRKKI